MKTIYLAGGCFWGVQKYFDMQNGITKTTVGYANGTKESPTYEEVCQERFQFAEAIEITFDPSIISLWDILDKYFQIIDPTLLNQQGNDIGVQYRTGIYYLPENKNTDIDIIKTKLTAEQAKYQKPLQVEIKPIENYYLAEEYHQNYLVKNPNGYCHIKFD